MNATAFDVATYAQFAHSAKGNIQIFVQSSAERPFFALLEQFREIAETLGQTEANVYYDDAYERIVIVVDSTAPELNTLTKFVDAATGCLNLVINNLQKWLSGTSFANLCLNIYVFIGLAGRNEVDDPINAAPWPARDRLFDTYVPIDQETADKFHPIVGSKKGMQYITGYARHIARITQIDQLDQEIRSNHQARLVSMITNYIRDEFTYLDRMNVSDRSFVAEITRRRNLREAAQTRAAYIRAVMDERFMLIAVA